MFPLFFLTHTTGTVPLHVKGQFIHDFIFSYLHLIFMPTLKDGGVVSLSPLRLLDYSYRVYTPPQDQYGHPPLDQSSLA